jgi:signal transduction histidine kinase
MKRRLYLKFVLVYLCFWLLSFVSVSTIISNLTEEHMRKTATEEMYREANAIASGRLAQSYREDSSSLQDIYNNLAALASYNSTEIWLMNTHGQILLDTSRDYDPEMAETVEGFDTTLLVGNYYQKGDFFGHFEEDMLSVVSPIISNYKAKGYIVIHCSLAQATANASSFLNLTYISLVITLLLSLLILVVFTLVVYRPLRRIIQGANEFAGGNLNYRVPVETDDEMGYLAASMNYMAGEINKSGEYQRKFISNISHDFRSPLTSIKGYVEAMLDGTIPVEMQDRYLNIVLTETERLNKLTQGLLTLNNYDDRKTYLEITEFDINEVIRRTAATFEGICNQKQVHIELIFDSQVLLVSADMSKIQQVLYNLIDNAIKFSHPESVIYIETTERREKVYVSVKDTGEGIPKESLPKIWERFYKTDPSRGKDKKGTGLGLAITKEIIQAHNENINVVSTEGVGSEFTFSLKKNKGRK